MTEEEKKAKDEISQQVEEWAFKYIGETFKFRPFQKQAVINIVYNIIYSHENHNWVIEAPTGSGKSLINIISAGVLATYYDKDSYILCSDLYLWQQYADFLNKHKQIGFGMLKGQTGNYQCKLNGEDLRNADCRLCGLSWAQMFNPKTANKYGYECAAFCEYVRARKHAVKSKVVLMTYQLFLYQINVVTDSAKAFAQRHVIFCDECHNIPDIISNNYSITVKESDFDRLYTLYDYAVNKAGDLFAESEFAILKQFTRQQLTEKLQLIWNKFTDAEESKTDDAQAIKDYVDLIINFKEITDSIQNDIAARKQAREHVGKDDLQLYKQCSFLSNYMCHWSDFGTAIEESGEQYTLKQVSQDKDYNDVVTFNCTKEDYMTWKFLLSQAEYRVMTSATVGGKEPFEENLGAKYTEDKSVKLITIPSTFDFTQSPVIFLNRYKMSYKEKDKSFASLKPIVYNILEKFEGKKGIIQTGSYANAKQLIFDAPAKYQKRLLLYNDNKEKNAVIRKHKMSTDTILVGPTLCEGIDLPDDECRFIVILKVPYPSLADKLVKEKMKLFPLWYGSKTSNSIIQGIGRGIRNDLDYCTTYILDGCFYNLYTTTKEQYSTELQERIKMYS